MTTQLSERQLEYLQLLNDERWITLRNRVLIRDCNRCVNCHKSANDIKLHVHHRYYIDTHAPWQYELSALLTLCENCHHAVHKYRDVQKEKKLVKAMSPKHFESTRHKENYYNKKRSGFKDVLSMDYKMPFGKFKGRRMKNLLQHEFNYVKWLIVYTDIIVWHDLIDEFLKINYSKQMS